MGGHQRSYPVLFYPDASCQGLGKTWQKTGARCSNASSPKNYTWGMLFFVEKSQNDAQNHAPESSQPDLEIGG